jgi:hypothetical protein
VKFIVNFDIEKPVKKVGGEICTKKERSDENVDMIS